MKHQTAVARIRANVAGSSAKIVVDTDGNLFLVAGNLAIPL